MRHCDLPIIPLDPANDQSGTNDVISLTLKVNVSSKFLIFQIYKKRIILRSLHPCTHKHTYTKTHTHIYSPKIINMLCGYRVFYHIVSMEYHVKMCSHTC